jgi:hypothetical protein
METSDSGKDPKQAAPAVESELAEGKAEGFDLCRFQNGCGFPEGQQRVEARGSQ